jgi:hypothetical protein
MFVYVYPYSKCTTVLQYCTQVKILLICTYVAVDFVNPGEVVRLLGVLPKEGAESPPGGGVVLVAEAQVPLPCTPGYC